MNVIGVTGIIGSGKSSVCEIFKIIGIPVFYADIESKRFLEDKAVIYQLQKLFGEDVCNRDGNVDRKFLAEHVFDNQEKLIQLNSILHPKVKLRFDEWKNDNADHSYGIIEAAILFESGFNRFCDAVIVVNAPDELCIQRVIERERCSRAVVKQRMKNQWNNKRKIKLADYILVNDETQSLIQQVLQFNAKLKGLVK
ncbi:MAG TPA: dephospho-CoA kinase [Bacteroidales bacterium]|nr:dephospho-CoA kinase [Bacteroidales bacterium]